MNLSLLLFHIVDRLSLKPEAFLGTPRFAFHINNNSIRNIYISLKYVAASVYTALSLPHVISFLPRATLCLKYRLDCLFERRGVILFRLTTGLFEKEKKRKGDRGVVIKEEEDAREQTRATSSGLAGGNNHPRGFESSPTDSRKLVSSNARHGAQRAGPQ